MATNPYFKEYIGEQRLLNDTVIEIIKTMGRDMIYVPREYVNRDLIFGEDVLSRFKNGYTLEMYIQNVTSFGGQMNIINKFGINITDRVTLQVSKTRFEQEVCTRESTIRTPREGDLIYFPFNKSLFEINYVEDKIPFFQFGTLNTYTLTCELFTYSYETIETGITEIDEVEEQRKHNMYAATLSSAPVSGIAVLKRGELIYQVNGVTGSTASYGNATAEAIIVEYTGNTTYLKGVSGTFAFGASGTQSIKGLTSGTEYYILGITSTNVNLSVDPIAGYGEIENDIYAEKADTQINFTRDNPFSEECS